MQKPHWSAWWRRNASCSGVSGPSLGERLDRLDRRPSACTASTQQPRTADAVEAHRARAADAVLAADVGAGQPEPVAQEVRQQQPRLDGSRDDAAVDGERDLDHAALSIAPRRRARRSALRRYRGARVDRARRVDEPRGERARVGGSLARPTIRRAALSTSASAGRPVGHRADGDRRTSRSARRRAGARRRPSRARSRRRAARAPRTRSPRPAGRAARRSRRRARPARASSCSA